MISIASRNDYWWSWVVDASNSTKQIPIVNRLPVFGGEAAEGSSVLEITEIWGALCHSMSLQNPGGVAVQRATEESTQAWWELDHPIAPPRFGNHNCTLQPTL